MRNEPEVFGVSASEIERFANSSDRIWPVVGAAAGSAVGRFGGAYLADMIFEPPAEGVEPTTKEKVLHALVGVIGSAGLAAAGAAIGAPPQLRTRAAVGAALGGAIPMPNMFGTIGGTLAGSAASGTFTYLAMR